MVYEDFDHWFNTVQALTAVPVRPNDQWYDAFLAALDPREAVHIIRPASSSNRGRNLKTAIARFFN